jgi:hypothetical protein
MTLHDFASKSQDDLIKWETPDAQLADVRSFIQSARVRPWRLILTSKFLSVVKKFNEAVKDIPEGTVNALRRRVRPMSAEGVAGQAAPTDDLEIWDERTTEIFLSIRLYRPRQSAVSAVLPALVMYIKLRQSGLGFRL